MSQNSSRGYLVRSIKENNMGATTTVREVGGSNTTYSNGTFMARDNNEVKHCELITHTLTTLGKRSDVWFADSGATYHMTRHFEWFSDFKPISEGQWQVQGISANPIYARGIGRIDIDQETNALWRLGSHDEVLFLPDLASNLFSLSQVATRGIDTLCTHDKCYLLAQGEVVMEGILE